MQLRNILALAGCTIALLAPAGAAPANRARVAAPQAGRLALISRLNLTVAQRTRVRAIRQDARAAAQRIRSDASLTAEQKRTRVRETITAARRQVASVLTPAQKAKLARLVRQRGRLRNLLARLNLTPAQKQAVRGYVRDSAAEARQVRANTGLTAEQRRARLLEVRRSLRLRVFAALTPVQRARVRAWLRA